MKEQNIKKLQGLEASMVVKILLSENFYKKDGMMESLIIPLTEPLSLSDLIAREYADIKVVTADCLGYNEEDSEGFFIRCDDHGCLVTAEFYQRRGSSPYFGDDWKYEEASDQQLNDIKKALIAKIKSQKGDELILPVDLFSV